MTTHSVQDLLWAELDEIGDDADVAEARRLRRDASELMEVLYGVVPREQFPTFVRTVEAALSELRTRAASLGEEHSSGLTEGELEALEQGGFVRSSPDAPSVNPAVRTAARYVALLANALTVRQAAERLGVNESRIRQRLSERSIIGWKKGKSWMLPHWQFTPEGQLIPGVDAVAAALASDLHPVAAWRWFTLPNPDLPVEGNPVSPAEWLLSGGDARLVAEQAAEL